MKELSPDDLKHLEAAQGWLMLLWLAFPRRRSYRIKNLSHEQTVALAGTRLANLLNAELH